MNSRTLLIVIALITGALAFSLSAGLGAEVTQAADVPSPSCMESKTTFLDVSRFGRKHSAAKNMTKLHESNRLEGWVFADLELYNENADLEGFFVTYTRAAPCP